MGNTPLVLPRLKKACDPNNFFRVYRPDHVEDILQANIVMEEEKVETFFGSLRGWLGLHR